MASLWSLLLTAAVSVIFGVAAWVATNFFAAPLLEFYKLRKAVYESLFFTANVGKISSDDHIASAITELRRHAAALSALWITAPLCVQKYLLWKGYKVESASSGLIGFSNTIDKVDGSRAIHRYDVETGLRFPMSYTDGIREIRRERSNR